MQTPCSAAPEQMDFFGVSQLPAFDASASIARSAVASLKVSSAVQLKEVASESYEPQLSLGLPVKPLNNYTWSDSDCLTLRDGILRSQLRLLIDERTTPQLRSELIAWVAAPKQTLEELKKTPFAFEVCCAAAGVNFEMLRERVLSMFAPELLAQLD